ncbi:tetratricopeptide repeat protein, partial [Leptolyngbya sp. FACHB-36]|uniref:Sll0314/Alr1548 family TPR repeat-containing protein n=1 Tax=Leptolyngbya sp. FACHB-36 TaxID=2692808 RepID=UPI001681AAC0
LPVASAALVSVGLWASPSLAKDPFRTTNARSISPATEAAFQALFRQGNYTKAAKDLNQADANEPLTQALRASLAYTDWQGASADQRDARLDQFRIYAAQTRQTAQAMLQKDPLRGNLYLAVGHFLESAYIFSKDGTVKGTPQVLGQIQQAFKYLDAAEAASPNDPELSLIKGYMDLFVALNLPFSSPSQAIERLDKYAAPRYLANRGIALGYRDLNQPDKALVAIEQAIQESSGNPELLYLKAQILVRQGNNRDSITWFQQALQKGDQLPAGMRKQIQRELGRAQQRSKNVGQ